MKKTMRCLKKHQLCISGNQTLSKFSSTKKIKRFSIFEMSVAIAMFKKKLNLNF